MQRKLNEMMDIVDDLKREEIELETILKNLADKEGKNSLSIPLPTFGKGKQ